MKIFFKKIKPYIYTELFYFFAILFLLFVILEIIFPNIILAYFNLNYLFILIVLSGLLSLKSDSNN